MIKIQELESVTAEIHIERERNKIKAYELAKRSVVQWPGRSIDMLVNNKVAFESGYFLLSGSLVYSRLNKNLITRQLIRKLTSIQNKISSSNNNLTS